uniref:Uncharacterized protein n=1 Tax=Monodon monoceros TaxID=40151 RepID=A0A8C6C0B5_MONMO
MQEREEISNAPEIFYSVSFLVKESLRYMIYIHTDCSTFTKPTAYTGTQYLATCAHVTCSGNRR